MTEHPNAALYRRLFAAMTDEDMDTIAAAVSDDIVYHTIGSSEPLRGREAVLASFSGLDEAGFEFEADIHDVVANDEHVIALVTARVARGDDSIEYRTAEILHVKDGKFTERWAFSDDTEAINRFFGS